jgi:hypothetical protein
VISGFSTLAGPAGAGADPQPAAAIIPVAARTAASARAARIVVLFGDI